LSWPDSSRKKYLELKSLETRITAEFQGIGGDNRAKSEHVYFINGMLVLLLTLASQNRK